jgi:POT family proton-dependent oligopeptide transporter
MSSAAAHSERHPPGLYVLFFTEMWERFGFYTIVAMFTLYLRNPQQGFGWTEADATKLYANYLMFVYASPLIGGWLADRGLGYRNSVFLGGLIFMIGYALLAIHSEPIVYLALVCLVVGNGFFKPNVSAMVGGLYPEGSHLKDRAYNIFYMGINIGAFFAPVVAEFMQARFGFNPAFAVASLGMVISVSILWYFRSYVEKPAAPTHSVLAEEREVGLAEDVPEILPENPVPTRAIDAIPDWKRIAALIVIFLIVIVFWMVFHQNGSTLTYWANDNTDWKVSGIISNAINPFWVVTLTFPLVWFWKWLDSKGLEPSTPTKMALGMVLTCVAFLIMYLAARVGESSAAGGQPYAYRVSPAWLIGAYGVLTLAELCLSPMGLSLVSKVAPPRLRGLMMGGWFVATAIGNKLTMIGVFWTEWLHSTFWLLLSGLSLATALVLLLLLRPLKRAMPGV